MKKYLLGITTFLVIFFSMSAFADRIVIKGTPTPLTEQGDVWVYPGPTVTPVSGDYYYFQTGNISRVCSTRTIPTISAGATPFKVKVGETVTTYQCYEPTYFDISE